MPGAQLLLGNERLQCLYLCFLLYWSVVACVSVCEVCGGLAEAKKYQIRTARDPLLRSGDRAGGLVLSKLTSAFLLSVSQLQPLSDPIE